jgi:hypothetical protein
MKTKVVHSQSKTAWNIIGTELGGKFKIARIPYVCIDDEIHDTMQKSEALKIALFVSKSMQNYNK